jgi:hypothetical protein
MDMLVSSFLNAQILRKTVSVDGIGTGLQV